MYVAKALIMYKKLICIFPSRFFYTKAFGTVATEPFKATWINFNLTRTFD